MDRTEFLSAPENYRTDGHLDKSKYAPFPFCAARAENLESEMGGNKHDRFLAVVRRERECSAFIIWVPSLGLKEHREMYAEQQMRQWQAEQQERRDRFEMALRQADLDRQERQRTEDLQRAKEQRNSDRTWAVGLIFLTAILAVFFGLIQLILAKVIK